MISARQMVEEVSIYLVDQDPDAPYEHWSETDLLSYFRLAVGIVASIQKDKFVRRVSMPIVAGAVQTAPDICHDMMNILGQYDSSGVLTNFPRRVIMDGMHLSGKIGCPTNMRGADADNYVVDSWRYDSSNPNIIYIDPPAPTGVNATLEITCFAPPRVDTLDSEVDLGDQLRPAIFELMLYYAYGVDTESVPSRDRSAVHWNNAFALLGLDGGTTKTRYAATRLPEMRLGAQK